MSSESGESEPSIANDEPENVGLDGRGSEPESLENGLETQALRSDGDEEHNEAVEELPPQANGRSFRGYATLRQQGGDEASSSSSLPQRAQDVQSPEGSALTVDDAPSIQGSARSSVGSSMPASLASSPRRHPPGTLQPFDRRFSSRHSISPMPSPRALSPAFLNSHSRQSSISSQIFGRNGGFDTPQTPWEVVRWTKLRKLSGQIFSEVGRRNFGRPSCLAVSASIVVGTSKGYILVFDYQQILKSIIGPGTKAVECGSVTSLAVSADHATVAGGHATGHMFVWELSRPAKPLLHIPPMEVTQLANRKSDGHIHGSSVLHVGFLGTRHTALVSADDHGMAFSQLATRGLGAVGRTVKTARILGRYPPAPGIAERPRKPSSVLAFSPLPLGNVEHVTDTLGLTALLTPYLLVIVSTTPVAETQHKAPRPKEVAPHSAQSGCLAWFPPVRLKDKTGGDKHIVSKPKLAYCWSNVLTVLDIDQANSTEKDKPPELTFRPYGRKAIEEAIVAVQWLTRSVLALLSISQKLIILEDHTLRFTDSFDLLPKHMFHQDLFSRQLRPVIEQLDENDASMHGVVADAFYMSFRAYKNRLFILGFNDISVGALSNWADRLLALIEGGDSIGAIRLATSYYIGDADRLTVGLPDDDQKRHDLVGERILEMINATLRYTFTRIGDLDDHPEEIPSVKELAEVSFIACVSSKELDFLFEEAFEKFKDSSAEGIFYEVLEPYILDGTITSMPPGVLKDLITYFATNQNNSNLEQIICQLQTESMDINQVTTLCKQYSLYDALIYVWNQALSDYITPLIDLLSLVKKIQEDMDDDSSTASRHWTAAQKIFPYLACALTGRAYPGGESLPDEDAADQAKKDLYGFLFAGKHVTWPPGSRKVFMSRADDDLEPSFPYLRMILGFDTASLMSMLNEAFEDNFLNGDQSSPLRASDVRGNGDRQASSLVPTRQYIVSILLDIASADDFSTAERIYIHMFVARNLPKYPQFIILPGSSLHKTLVGLCDYPSEDIADDCQLSAEYLLSMYQPSDMKSLLPLFKRAKFYRVLKSVYRSSSDYSKLLETYLGDVQNREATFECIGDCLRPNRGLSKNQIRDVRTVILRNAKELADVNAGRLADILHTYAPDLLEQVLSVLEQGSEKQFTFLKTLLEPGARDDGLDLDRRLPDKPTSRLVEQYVQLMCSFNPSHVSDYISLLKSGDLRLDRVLPTMEESGVIDAAVVLLARDGLVREAMDRLIKHLGTLETALTGLVFAAAESPDAGNTSEAADDLVEVVQKYWMVGIWLCQGQSKTLESSRPAKSTARRREPQKIRSTEDPETDLEFDERLWLDLAVVMVRLTKSVTDAASDEQKPAAPTNVDAAKIITALRGTVQQTFTALLAATSGAGSSHTKQKRQSSPMPPTPSASSTVSAAKPHGPSFLHILRAFLARMSQTSPTLSDLRTVLSDIFAAHAFEETILKLSNRFLDKDAFSHLAEAHAQRLRGWRPASQGCEACKRRVWGPGVGSHVWEKWREGMEAERERRKKAFERKSEGSGKAKGKAVVHAQTPQRRDEETSEESDDEEDRSDDWGVKGKAVMKREERDLGPVVVFACRHMFHRRCLERIHGGGGGTGAPRMEASRLFVCPICP